MKIWCQAKSKWPYKANEIKICAKHAENDFVILCTASTIKNCLEGHINKSLEFLKYS